MKKQLLNKIKVYMFIVCESLFIISFCIAFVILFRPFYYYHISYLNIPKTTGYTFNEIKESYDDVIDYIVFNSDFKTGKLKYSLEGEDHFKDCKKLFTINFIILGLSSIGLLIKKRWYNNIKLHNYNISFWSSILVISIFINVLCFSIIVGFDKFFEIFHNIFFHGKDNWLLDSKTDEIIKILPQEFFMNCAILVLSIIFIITIIIIIKEISKRKAKIGKPLQKI